jgi:hypothetical protein
MSVTGSAHTDRHAIAHTECDRHQHVYADGHAEPNANLDCHADLSRHRDLDPHPDADRVVNYCADSHAHLDCQRYSDRDPDGHSAGDPDADWNHSSDVHEYSHADPHPNRGSLTNLHSNADGDLHSDRDAHRHSDLDCRPEQAVSAFASGWIPRTPADRHGNANEHANGQPDRHRNPGSGCDSGCLRSSLFGHDGRSGIGFRQLWFMCDWNGRI